MFDQFVMVILMNAMNNLFVVVLASKFMLTYIKFMLINTLPRVGCNLSIRQETIAILDLCL